MMEKFHFQSRQMIYSSDGFHEYLVSKKLNAVIYILFKYIRINKTNSVSRKKIVDM